MWMLIDASMYTTDFPSNFLLSDESLVPVIIVYLSLMMIRMLIISIQGLFLYSSIPLIPS